MTGATKARVVFRTANWSPILRTVVPGIELTETQEYNRGGPSGTLNWPVELYFEWCPDALLADEVNSGMPAYCVTKTQDALNEHLKPLTGSRILILRVAYKKDIDDVRESPALDIIHLLEQGYRVRGTLRTLSRESEVRETVRRFVQADERPEFTQADLLKEAGWPEAMQGCDYVLHVASPFPLLEPSHEDELIKPAVEGTLRVLRAAHAAQVKRVVQVSSNAAISAGHEGGRRARRKASA